MLSFQPHLRRPVIANDEMAPGWIGHLVSHPGRSSHQIGKGCAAIALALGPSGLAVTGQRKVKSRHCVARTTIETLKIVKSLATTIRSMVWCDCARMRGWETCRSGCSEKARVRIDKTVRWEVYYIPRFQGEQRSGMGGRS
jgi:hypothetical protein